MFRSLGRINFSILNKYFNLKTDETIITDERFMHILRNHPQDVVRLVLQGEDDTRKNSVMTFYRIREKNLEKLINKNKLLYSK